MKFELDKSRAICPQLCEYLCASIASGEVPTNEKLLSVREVAVNAGVNPNTVQKAYEQLEAKNVIYSIRGKGWYVSEDISPAVETAKEMVKNKTMLFLSDMKNLGVSREQVITYIKEWYE